MANIIRTFLVEDHELVRHGIRALLEEYSEVEVVSEASDGIEALEILKDHSPDLLISDIRMPRMNGIELVREVKKIYPQVKTLMLSMHDSEEYVVQSIEAGADGYLLKGSSKEEFIKAIRKIMQGEKYFSGDISTILINHFAGERENADKKRSEKKPKKDDPFQLTNREKQVLMQVLKGRNSQEIGEALNISKRTVEVHRFNLMKKMEVNNLIELTNVAREYGLDG